MNAPCPPQPRTRSVVACDLFYAEARLDALHKRAEILEPDSECSHQAQWHSTRASLLREELATIAESHPWSHAR